MQVNFFIFYSDSKSLLVFFFVTRFPNDNTNMQYSDLFRNIYESNVRFSNRSKSLSDVS